MRNNNYAKIIAVISILLATTPQSNSGELSSARAMAMGGAMTALASGVDAARYNPANLGLTGYTPLQIEFVSLGVDMSNNAFTLDDYNKYTGATLSTSDKAYILGQIPKEGWNIKADASAAAMSVGLGKFVFSIQGNGAADANLNKDILELMLNGNTYADSVVVTGSYSDGIAYASAGLSYGHTLYSYGSKELAVGATFKYIRGIAVEEIVKLEGLASTQATGFQGDGEIIARTATGGSGYAVDIGGALRLNDSYTVGLRIENILGSINWNHEPEEHGYIFSFDTLTLSNSDDVAVTDDYSVPISPFSTRLPPVMTVGVANRKGMMRWAVDWEQGFKRTAESSTKPRLSMGLEWLKLGMMPLRLGFSSGGGRGSSVSAGTGINLSPFYLDVAAVTGTSISVYSAKGLKLALSTGIRF